MPRIRQGVVRNRRLVFKAVVGIDSSNTLHPHPGLQPANIGSQGNESGGQDTATYRHPDDTTHDGCQFNGLNQRLIVHECYPFPTKVNFNISFKISFLARQIRACLPHPIWTTERRFSTSGGRSGVSAERRIRCRKRGSWRRSGKPPLRGFEPCFIAADGFRPIAPVHEVIALARALPHDY